MEQDTQDSRLAGLRQMQEWKGYGGVRQDARKKRSVAAENRVLWSESRKVLDERRECRVDNSIPGN
ncbi:hypothetical protein DPQ33_00010 [Oceanidesulfovibrio indonesiensis]|uniref:Uncharacterized protein n=1 Tax=Oceanidesulfovibrio indonesiensis TaxID=54767 RepID=A0A7M3MJQ5_9BACT|nr:hypothetical protein DPQ33_00010 [Oceanidesulfovibrio indonesiensis]